MCTFRIRFDEDEGHLLGDTLEIEVAANSPLFLRSPIDCNVGRGLQLEEGAVKIAEAIPIRFGSIVNLSCSQFFEEVAVDCDSVVLEIPAS